MTDETVDMTDVRTKRLDRIIKSRIISYVIEKFFQACLFPKKMSYSLKNNDVFQ